MWHAMNVACDLALLFRHQMRDDIAINCGNVIVIALKKIFPKYSSPKVAYVAFCAKVTKHIKCFGAILSRCTRHSFILTVTLIREKYIHTTRSMLAGSFHLRLL
jgi:hypothetical protein